MLHLQNKQLKCKKNQVLVGSNSCYLLQFTHSCSEETATVLGNTIEFVRSFRMLFQLPPFSITKLEITYLLDLFQDTCLYFK